MAIKVEHEMHHRRLGRNVGLGLVLIAFVVLVFGLTLVKTKRGDFNTVPPGQEQSQTQSGGSN